MILGKRRWLIWVLAVSIALPGIGAAVHFRDDLMKFFEPPAPKSVPHESYAQTNGGGTIVVSPEGKLLSRLVMESVCKEQLARAELQVTGFVIARLSAPEDGERTWDFASPDLGATYGDWIKASADIAFFREQSKEIAKLGQARIKKLNADVTRLTETTSIGAEPKEKLLAAEADLLQAQIQSRKDNHEADAAVKNAERTKTLLERQLLQNGLVPEKLMDARQDGAILVVADVPEGRIERLHLGQACDARFFSFPDKSYPGVVRQISPTVSKERRTIRVTFEVADKEKRLRPGLFADVGLGTEERTAVTVTSDAVLHIGKCDYVLRQVGTGQFQLHEVEVDEPLVSHPALKASRIVVRRGLDGGEQVVGAGAILLRPIAVQSLQPSPKQS